MSGHPWMDLPLAQFLETDGLLRLLYLTAKFKEHDWTNGFTEVIRRLHVPGYEQARGSITAAIAAGVFEESEHLSESDIAAILRWKAEQQPE